MRIRPSPLCASLLLFLAALVGCTKETREEEPPPISDYRTYDWVPVAVKEAGEQGSALLCKNTPIEGRTAFIQYLDADGTPGSRIDLDALPTTIETIQFAIEDVLYTDFVIAQDGTCYVVGTAIEADMDARLHLVVQHVDKNGNQLSAPFRRYITANAVVVTNDGTDLHRDLNGLPRQRALCGIYENDDLVVAVRWETAVGSGIRLYRFPVSDSNGTVLRWDHTLESPTFRLQQLACDPFSKRTAIVVDNAHSDGHGTEVWSTSPGSTGWLEPAHADLGLPNAEPQQLIWDGTSFLLTGYRPVADGGIDPFVSHFTDAGSAAGGTQPLSGLTDDGRPIAAFCTAFRADAYWVLVQTHEASALPPYFDGDISSDLSIVDLGVNAPPVADPIIPGQGLRAIAAFWKGNKRMVIGSQHPFLNAGYIHTFYLVLK